MMLKILFDTEIPLGCGDVDHVPRFDGREGNHFCGVGVIAVGEQCDLEMVGVTCW